MDNISILLDPAFIKLSAGLMLLMMGNILLGSINALFTKAFDWKRFFVGIGKGAVIVVSFYVVYMAGALNPDILAVDIGGQNLTILAAINTVVLFGYVLYAKQVVEKMYIIIKADYEAVLPVIKEPTIKPEEVVPETSDKTVHIQI